MKEWLPLGPRARAPGSGPGTRTGPRAGLTAELVGGPALLLIDLNQLKYQIRGPRSWIRCFLLFWLKGSNVLRLPALKMAGRPGRLPRLVNQPLPRPLPAVDYSSLWEYADRWNIDRIDEACGQLHRAAYLCAAGGGHPRPALLGEREAAEAFRRAQRMQLSVQALTWPGPGPRLPF